jgi:hypothetical protein
MYRGAVSKPEPDNRFTNELCAIANATESTGATGLEYWGWDDKQCGRKFPFMCRIIREWPLRPRPRLQGVPALLPC